MKLLWIFLILIFLIGIFYLIPVPEKSFRELFEGEEALASSLEQFRRQERKTLSVDGRPWRYLEVGQGPETILFLHGMGGGYDIWWQQIDSLKQDYRILSVTYPPVSSLEGMERALLAILDKEGIQAVSLVGSSLGGYLAQYLVAHSPERIQRAVFANTFPPNETLARQNKFAAFLAPVIPEWLVMNIFRKSIQEKVVPAAENNALVKAYLLEQSYGRMSKAQFVGRLECVLDHFQPASSPGIPLLIIESDNDPLLIPELRKGVKDQYPKADVFTFHNKGHFPYLNEPEAYTQVLRSFLEQGARE